ncbi:Abscisic acid receptor pyl1 [Stylosanthes scabra]|uniref:Abscisic acid receptor pyl1 n=1 Tax=Stylosanthes scabra TaxID=79078 RepID=A0ABU6UJF8_9FABA|nr:Abscisic acid receptor pyl1 [Stylosanthes scabra]
MEEETQTHTNTSTNQATQEPDPTTQSPNPTHHDLTLPSGLTEEEFEALKPSIATHHTYPLSPTRLQCSSLLAQRIHAPPHAVWSVLRRFDKPQSYKHFIKSCHVSQDFEIAVGCTRYVDVISGLPANTSTERLDVLDDDRHVIGFTIVGGEHRLRNYRSVTSLHPFDRDGKIWTVVLESYVVDVPEGNTEEDTRLFSDTVVKLNLQKLASVTEGNITDSDGK